METELKEKINNTQFGTEITIRGYFHTNSGVSKIVGRLVGFDFNADTVEMYDTTYSRPTTVSISKFASNGHLPEIEGHGPISTFGPDAKKPVMQGGVEQKLRNAAVGQHVSLKGNFSGDNSMYPTFVKGNLKNIDWSANVIIVHDTTYNTERRATLSEIQEVDPIEPFGGRHLFDSWKEVSQVGGTAWILTRGV